MSLPGRRAVRALFVVSLLAPPSGPAAAAAGEVAAPGPPGYAWPLAVKSCVTSSFGEYRARHFHGGLDLSTGGEEGKAVFAVADGEVWRVSVSPRAFGHALYLKLDDGRYALYAHLSRFIPPVEAYVREAQLREQTYVQDLRPAPGRFRVRRGELIAWSGQTGAGPPHLHFELRADENDPVNPEDSGFEVPDTGAPVPGAIAVEPLDRFGLVDGHVALEVFPVRWSAAAKAYVVPGVPRLRGRIGFSVAATDGTPGCDARLAPYSFQLVVDGQSIFTASLDRASYVTAPECDVIYRAASPDGSGERFFRLHRVAELPPSSLGSFRGDGVVNVISGAELASGDAAAIAGIAVRLDPRPARLLVSTLEWKGGDAAPGLAAPDPSAGAGDLFEGMLVAPGGHTYEIRLRDHAGNTSRITGRFVAEEEPESPGPGRREARELHWRRDCLEVIAALDGDFVSAPELRLGVTTSTMQRLRDSRWIGTIQPSADGSDRELEIAVHDRKGLRVLRGAVDPAVLVPRGARALLPIGDYAGGSGGVILLAANSLYFDTVFRIRPEPDSVDAAAAGGELTRVSPAWRIDAADAVFNQQPWIGLVGPDSLGSDPRVALYRREAGGPWRYVGREAGGGHTIGGAGRATGVLALFRDSRAPLIEDLAAPRVAGDSIEVRARVRDGGSGLDPDGIELTIDGAWVPAEWDPERELVQYRFAVPPHGPVPSVHLLVIDRAGNRARSSVP